MISCLVCGVDVHQTMEIYFHSLDDGYARDMHHEAEPVVLGVPLLVQAKGPETLVQKSERERLNDEWIQTLRNITQAAMSAA